MKILTWIWTLITQRKQSEEMNMPKLVGNIEKVALSELRSAELVATITDSIYIGYSQEDAQAAVTEFIGHLTLSDEDGVKATCGDYFDKIQAALAEQEQTIATQIADKVIAADKETVKGFVQTYVDKLQYKHSIDDGQDAQQEQQESTVQ